MEYRGLFADEETFPTCDREAANEFGRLAQGVGGRIEGWKTILSIPRLAVPKGKPVTYGHFVVAICSNKETVHRVRVPTGGNLIQYPGDISTWSDYLTTSKCMPIITIYAVGTKHMCLDVKKFYLGTPIDSFGYLHTPSKLIP
jgi:hypothetical protein